MKRFLTTVLVAVAAVIVTLSWTVRHHKGVAAEEKAAAVALREAADVIGLERAAEARNTARLEAEVVAKDSAVAEAVLARQEAETEASNLEAAARRRGEGAVVSLREFLQDSPAAMAKLDTLLTSHAEQLEAASIRKMADSETITSLRMTIVARDSVNASQKILLGQFQVEVDSLHAAFDVSQDANASISRALAASETRWKWAKKLAVLPPFATFILGRISKS